MEGARKYFVGGNWKSNGTEAFVKEMIEGTINKMEYNKEKCGKLNTKTKLFLNRGLHCSSGNPS